MLLLKKSFPTSMLINLDLLRPYPLIRSVTRKSRMEFGEFPLLFKDLPWLRKARISTNYTFSNN